MSGFQNYGTSAYIKKNNKSGRPLVAVAAAAAAAEVYTKNVQFNDKRESRAPRKVRGLPEWQKFFSRARAKIFSLDAINS